MEDVRELVSVARGGRWNRPGARSLGVYRAVIEAWEDPAALAQGLREALDWHLERTRPRDKGDSAEFEDLLVFAFPAEVLGVLRVREALSLPVPAVTHPLLDNPLGVPPPARKWPPDALLRRCQDYLDAL